MGIRRKTTPPETARPEHSPQPGPSAENLGRAVPEATRVPKPP